MGYFTCYDIIKKGKNAILDKANVHPVPCFSSIFDKEAPGKIIMYIPIDYIDSNHCIDTTWVTAKDIKKYLSMLKRVFGGIYSVEERVVSYRIGITFNHDTQMWGKDIEHINSIVIRINYDKLKGDNKNYTVKHLLTMIRYIYEIGQIKALKFAINIKPKFPKLDLTTLMLNYHLINGGNNHSIAMKNRDNTELKRFDAKFIFKKEFILTNSVTQVSSYYPKLEKSTSDKLILLYENSRNDK